MMTNQQSPNDRLGMRKMLQHVKMQNNFNGTNFTAPDSHLDKDRNIWKSISNQNVDELKYSQAIQRKTQLPDFWHNKNEK